MLITHISNIILTVCICTGMLPLLVIYNHNYITTELTRLMCYKNGLACDSQSTKQNFTAFFATDISNILTLSIKIWSYLPSFATWCYYYTVNIWSGCSYWNITLITMSGSLLETILFHIRDYLYRRLITTAVTQHNFQCIQNSPPLQIYTRVSFTKRTVLDLFRVRTKKYSNFHWLEGGIMILIWYFEISYGN